MKPLWRCHKIRSNKKIYRRAVSQINTGKKNTFKKMIEILRDADLKKKLEEDERAGYRLKTDY